MNPRQIKFIEQPDGSVTIECGSKELAVALMCAVGSAASRSKGSVVDPKMLAPYIESTIVWHTAFERLLLATCRPDTDDPDGEDACEVGETINEICRWAGEQEKELMRKFMLANTERKHSN